MNEVRQNSHMLCDYTYMRYQIQVNPWKQRANQQLPKAGLGEEEQTAAA